MAERSMFNLCRLEDVPNGLCTLLWAFNSHSLHLGTDVQEEY